MKKRIISAAIAFLLFATAFSETRTFYVARHGQRGSPDYKLKLQNIEEDVLVPAGKEQAERLGAYLNDLGFSGEIFCSPLYRTMETATYICSQLPVKKITLEPGIQETAEPKKSVDGDKEYGLTTRSITIEETKKYFPGITIPKDFVFPWRLKNEKKDLRNERYRNVIKKYLAETEGDILFVGHGECLTGVLKKMLKEEDRKFHGPGKAVNCYLMAFEFDCETGKILEGRDHTYKYLPKKLITNNFKDVDVPDDAKKNVTDYRKH